jgi:TonB family protein
MGLVGLGILYRLGFGAALGAEPDGSLVPAEVPPEAPPEARPEAPPERGVQLPVLVSHIPAAYPERALERALQADVELELTVDEEGRVGGVRLVTGAGHGFDGPAVEAAYSMQFTPALNARGQPVPATLTYRYLFRMDAVPPLSIEGSVRIRGEKKVVADALIRAGGPDGQEARTRSDANGRFRFAALPPGEWVLTASGPGVMPSSAAVQVEADAYVDGVTLSVDAVPEWLEYEEGVSEYVEVTTSRQADPAEREVSADTVVNLPGSLGDPMRALQNMPGVARAAFGSGQIAVRGTGTEDTGYLIDGLRVPIVFHFTAVSTVVSPELMSNIGFYPGGWSVRYGRALGAVVDLHTNDQIPRRSQTGVSADLFQVSAFTRQRLSPKTSLLVSARRSYIDAIAGPAQAALGAEAIRLPRYYDAQVHFVRAIGDGGLLTFTGLLSNDEFGVIGDSGAEAVSYRTSFQKLMARHLQPLGSGWSVETAFALGPERQELVLEGDAGLGGVDLPVDFLGALPTSGLVSERSTPLFSLRHEWFRDPAGDLFGLRVGVDANFGQQKLEYALGQATPENGEAMVWLPAAYVEPSVNLGPVELLPGLRLEAVDLGPTSVDDPNNPVMDWVVDARLRAVGTFGATRVLVNAGQYSQPPGLRELLSENGTSLTLERSTQVSAGVQQRVLGDASVGITVYHSSLDQLIVGRDDVFRFDRTTLVPGERYIPFLNAGTGRAYGAELFGNWITDERIVWLAVSLSRSLRRDLPDEEVAPSASDAPVNATFIVSQAFGKWRLGARTRYTSGAPLTPVTATVYSSDLQTWVPIYGDPYSARAPAFFSLDLRVDREWWFDKWRLASYLEVQNATNHRNVEIPGYSEDYTEEQSVTGLPILPVFGLRATW